MSGINKVIIIGRLGKDPEVRYTTGGQAVASFSVATSEEWKDKESGEKKERTEWHNITVWGKLAELCGEYLSKGRQVYIEGKLQTDSYEDKEHIKRYVTKIIASTVQFLGSGGGQTNGEAAKPKYKEDREYPQDRGPKATSPDDDIPF